MGDMGFLDDKWGDSLSQSRGARGLYSWNHPPPEIFGDENEIGHVGCMTRYRRPQGGPMQNERAIFLCPFEIHTQNRDPYSADAP
jgi:hypothetical protein